MVVTAKLALLLCDLAVALLPFFLHRFHLNSETEGGAPLGSC